MAKGESYIARMISTRIKKRDPRAEIFLFGSHARGQASDESDWDVLILIDQPKLSRSVEEIYRDEMFDLELELGVPISTFVYSKTDWETKYVSTPFYQNIQQDGIKLA